jgi:hypothetical protein
MTLDDFTNVSVGDSLKWVDSTPPKSITVQVVTPELVSTDLGLCCQAVYQQAGKAYAALIPIQQLKRPKE